MARKRRKEDESLDKGSPAWMTTYSDMVTLLLAFFIILFSFSTIDEFKFEQAMASLQKALGILDGGKTIVTKEPLVDFTDLTLEERMELRDIQQMEEVIRLLEDHLREAGVYEHVTITIEERGAIVKFADQVLFDSGRAVLRLEALDILHEVAVVLNDIPNHIRIEGHTDNRPINTVQFPSNWELSTTRATNVLRYLVEEEGISPTRISAAGYGEYRPIETNSTPEGRQANRRVDIVILYMSAIMDEPRGEDSNE